MPFVHKTLTTSSTKVNIYGIYKGPISLLTLICQHKTYFSLPTSYKLANSHRIIHLIRILCSCYKLNKYIICNLQQDAFINLELFLLKADIN